MNNLYDWRWIISKLNQNVCWRTCISYTFLYFKIWSNTENVEMDDIEIEEKMHSDGCIDGLFWYRSINLQWYSDTHEKTQEWRNMFSFQMIYHIEWNSSPFCKNEWDLKSLLSDKFLRFLLKWQISFKRKLKKMKLMEITGRF